MCFHDLWSGVALAPRLGPCRGPNAVSEQELAEQMLGELPFAALVLGDRNFGVFSVVQAAQRFGHEVLFRLTTTRAKYLLGGEPKSENVDQEVVWRASANDLKKHPELSADAAVVGRVIRAIVRNPDCKPLELYLFTTSSESAAKLVKLYREREKIEHDIRSLKYTLGLEMLYSRTPEMLEKEFLLGMFAYNLLRVVIARAARKLKLEPRQISFSRGAALTRIFGNQLLEARSPSQRKRIEQRFLAGLRQSKLPNRSRYRVEPRKLASKKKCFPVITTSREQERQRARECLEKHGHRGYLTSVNRRY
jgi:hypothetical protein